LAKLNNIKDARSGYEQAIENANKSQNNFYIATAYQEAARVEFLAENLEVMINMVYAGLGALKLESDPHAKRHAELYLALSWAYNKLGNKDLTTKAKLHAEESLKYLDKETVQRIQNYFNQ
jgi:hypothetical protein